MPAAAEPTQSLLTVQRQALAMLVGRDLRRFFRQRSRIVGALLQPLIFWAVIGSGLSGSFRMPGERSVGYLQYFYPGTLVLVVLFTAIFTTMSVIEDRQRGFLQAVLAAPVSRVTLVLGKTLGSVAIALIQGTLFLLLCPLAGYSLAAVNVPLVLTALVLIGVALAAVGFALAWVLESTQGYHVLMNVLLIPAWILSGAMFPIAGAAPWLRAIMRLNPLSHGVELVRSGLVAGWQLSSPELARPIAVDLLVVALAALAAVVFAAAVSRRKE